MRIPPTRLLQPSRRTTSRVNSGTGISALLFFLLFIGMAPPAYALEVAILKSSDLTAYNTAVAGIKAAFPAGTTFLEYEMQGDVTRGRMLARKILASDAGLVFAVGLKAALVAKLEILDTPVIFCMVLDPAKHDLRAPNMTGVLMEVPLDRQLSTLRSVIPAARRIGLLYDPEKSRPLVEEAQRRAKALSLDLIAKPISSEKEVPAALRTLVQQIDALWLIPDSTVLTEESIRFLLSTALDASIPVLAFSPDLVKSGALVGLSVNYEEVGRQSATVAKTILAGKTGPSLGLLQPARPRLSLNLKTAKFLGITIPPELVTGADDLY